MKPLATEKGKAFALAALQSRRETNRTRTRIDNSALYAGSPMYFDCISCGDVIAVPEDYITRATQCAECNALRLLGWLE